MIGTDAGLKSQAKDPFANAWPKWNGQPAGPTRIFGNPTVQRPAAPAATPAAPAAPSINYTTYGTIKPPQYISDQATSDVQNNQLAQGDAASDIRGLKKSFISAGRSLGAGENFHAGVASAATQQGARNEAANTGLNDAAQNSKMTTDYQYAREMEGQRLGALQQGLGQTQWASQFNDQTNAARRMSAAQNAKLQVLGPMMEMYGNS